jgi:hypothetical protein
MFVYYAFEDQGSGLVIQGYTDAARAMGHEVCVYGRDNPKIPLNYSLECVSHQLAMRCMTRHLAHQEQRRMTQFHRLASLGSQRCHFLSRDFGHEFRDPSGDLYSVLVELLFPEEAGEYRPAKLRFSRNIARTSTLVSLRCVVQIQSVQFCHGWLLVASC